MISYFIISQFEKNKVTTKIITNKQLNIDKLCIFDVLC